MEEIAGSVRHANEAYETPELVDYGSLVELTASNQATEMEDGIGKLINTDGSNGLVP